MTMQNRFVAKLPDGSVYCYSYDTIIGFWSPRLMPLYYGFVFTDEKIGPATNRHRNQFLAEVDGTVIDAAEFKRLLDRDKNVLDNATRFKRLATKQEAEIAAQIDARVLLETENSSLRRQIRDLKALVELSLDERG